MRLRIQRQGDPVKHVIQLQDSDTIKILYHHITQYTQLDQFTIKSGFPPKAVDCDDVAALVSSKFNSGEALLIEKMAQVGTTVQQATSSVALRELPKPATPDAAPALMTRKKEILQEHTKNDDTAPPEVQIAGRGLLVLRIQPDDNSCLFRAIGYLCMRSIDAMEELRGIIAMTIQDQPEVFSDAVLGMSRDLYAAKMNRPDTWGGEIEMKILSDHFNVQIAAIDCKSGHIYRYGETYSNCVYLVYSGVHYDSLALSPTENAPPDWDLTQFDSNDGTIQRAALDLVALLRKRNYFTDTASFDLRCNDCGNGLKGEKGAQAHARQTGHVNFGEF